MGEITKFPGTKNIEEESDKVTVEDVLTLALSRDLSMAVVVGMTQEGEFYLSCSDATLTQCVAYMEIAKKHFLDEI